MIQVRTSDARGHAQHGWLDSHHTFSFANYYDPKHMGFGPLRVINEDRVSPGRGFGRHPHRNMEIISYVLDGALEHKDSMGTGSVIRPGDVQLMSAGRGVTHSEFNASTTEPVHFLQIWIMPEEDNTTPSYQQAHFDPAERRNQWQTLVSPTGDDGALKIRQDARLLGTVLGEQEELRFEPQAGRVQWLHVVRGTVTLNAQTTLSTGDAAAITDEQMLHLRGIEASEVLLFDMVP